MYQEYQTSEASLFRCNMADKDFIRDSNSGALINNDVSGFEHYRMNRRKAKKDLSVEQRLRELERLVDLLIKERN